MAQSTVIPSPALWRSELALLLNEAVRDGSTFKQIVARCKGYPGLGARTLEKMRAGHYDGSLANDRIEVLAHALGQTAEYVTQRLGAAGKPFMEVTPRNSTTGADIGPVLDEDAIRAEQDLLAEGDEVWLVSSRRFLEPDDEAIYRTVTANLKEGVRYRYFYPNTKDALFGNEARTSFEEFVGRLVDEPNLGALIPASGHQVDVNRFNCFSPLHTLVHHRSVRRHSQHTYLFLEAEDRAGSKRKLWVRVDAQFRERIEGNLRKAATFAADPLPFPQNENGLQKRYREYFGNAAGAAEYASFVSALDRNPGHGVAAVMSPAIAKHTARFDDDVEVLDIGCGDGTNTLALLRPIIDAGKKVRVHLVEPSLHQGAQAEKRIRTLGSRVSVKLHNQPLAAALSSLRGSQFDLILSVHSLYVVGRATLALTLAQLKPHGRFLIWLGYREGCSLNALCHRIDESLFQGLGRHYAEDVLQFLELDCLSFHAESSTRVYERPVAPLAQGTQLTAFGELASSFYSLGQWSDVNPAVKTALAAVSATEDARTRNAFITVTRSIDRGGI